jgi:hypothetical protein
MKKAIERTGLDKDILSNDDRLVKLPLNEPLVVKGQSKIYLEVAFL